MAGLFAKGTALWVGDDASPPLYTKIANVKSISGPDINVTVVDTTTHSTVGNFREKAAVLIDAGQVGFEINFDPDDPTLDPTASNTLWDNCVNLRTRSYQLRLAPSNVGNEMMVFNGFVTKHGFMFPVDNVQTCNMTIDIDGEPIWDTFTP